MKRWKKRAAIIGGGLAVVGIAAALVLNALNSNIALYVTPSEVAAGKAPKAQAFRIGGSRGNRDLQPRNVGKEHLDGLGVLRGELEPDATGATDDHRHLELAAKHVADLRGVLDNLVVGGGREV